MQQLLWSPNPSYTTTVAGVLSPKEQRQMQERSLEEERRQEERRLEQERRQEERRLEEERRQEERRLEEGKGQEEKRQEEEKRRQEEEGDLLSQQMESALALLQPQPDKEQCPPMVCKVKHKTRNVTWIACDACNQWYHIKCVGLTAKKAESLPNRNCGLC